MHIVHVAAEIAPVAKVGGLGDVLLGLPNQLALDGHDVEVIVPKYDILDVDGVRELDIIARDFSVTYDGKKSANTIWQGWVGHIKVYFIESHDEKLFFSRGLIYGCEDDVDRFLYFSKAALTWLESRSKRPDVLHIHDWHVAAIAPLFKQIPTKKKTAVVFTIHNLLYQGRVSEFEIDKLGVVGRDTRKKFQDDHDPHLLNLMKGGIVFSDAVTTVSKTYSKEIQTKKYGFGLEKLLKSFQSKLHGMVNGLDYGYWNPETDPLLPAHYSSREKPLGPDDHNLIDRKAYVKNLFREELMLDEVHRPLIGCVSRLVPQKGVELIRHALFYALENKAQFILLGTSPIPEISREFHELMHRFEGHPHVRLILKHEEETAHRIFAASDLFIVPSQFEPCGLTQLIALRYGSVPVVRKTGGLADTVFDIDSSAPAKKRNGFVFEEMTNEAFTEALDRATSLWFDHPKEWRSLVAKGMKMDFSWKEAAKKYLKLFESLLL